MKCVTPYVISNSSNECLRRPTQQQYDTSDWSMPEEVGQQFAKHHGAKCSARHVSVGRQTVQSSSMDALQPQETPCRLF